MLVEFRVSNFRSLRDEQVLSLVASTDKFLRDTHTLATGQSAAPALLRSAVIYGANAGGKSNLIKALQYMQGVVMTSANLQPQQPYDDLQPFRLNTEYEASPSQFEVTFIRDGIRYQYGFALNHQRIVSEHLLVYKTAKPQTWFDRHVDEQTGKDVYAFGAGLKGAKHLWEGATRPNSLFLSMAVQLNSESLRPVFDWFASELIIINEQSRLSPHTTIQMLKQHDGRKRICDFLSAADISIADIAVDSRKVSRPAVYLDERADSTDVRLEDVRIEEVEQHRLRFSHITDHGQAEFDLGDESSGTRNFLFLAGPVLDILQKGLTLIVDELDTSLHTLLVRELVRLFHQPEINAGGAQLIFTTHDTSLLDAEDLFRRDQVWFIEKDCEQASSLIPLLDYSPRKNEALERGYLIGRYGGIPFLEFVAERLR